MCYFWLLVTANNIDCSSWLKANQWSQWRVSCAVTYKYMYVGVKYLCTAVTVKVLVFLDWLTNERTLRTVSTKTRNTRSKPGTKLHMQCMLGCSLDKHIFQSWRRAVWRPRCNKRDLGSHRFEAHCWRCVFACTVCVCVREGSCILRFADRWDNSRDSLYKDSQHKKYNTYKVIRKFFSLSLSVSKKSSVENPVVTRSKIRGVTGLKPTAGGVCVCVCVCVCVWNWQKRWGRDGPYTLTIRKLHYPGEALLIFSQSHPTKDINSI